MKGRYSLLGSWLEPCGRARRQRRGRRSPRSPRSGSGATASDGRPRRAARSGQARNRRRRHRAASHAGRGDPLGPRSHANPAANGSNHLARIAVRPDSATTRTRAPSDERRERASGRDGHGEPAKALDEKRAPRWPPNAGRGRDRRGFLIRPARSRVASQRSRVDPWSGLLIGCPRLVTLKATIRLSVNLWGGILRGDRNP
jgi:hypothetical protein